MLLNVSDMRLVIKLILHFMIVVGLGFMIT